ncbi:MAG: FprA family A-type flavoprotein [Lachnospiraceae bacterium]|nr:FprA family A-type flavoprotein [Lachnospiraceae bacterium]
MEISENIRYVGVDDGALDLFEGQYRLDFGVTYNSYVILDEKIAVLDTVDRRATGEWLLNIKKVLNGRKPDYLIVQHLEPDHSGGISELCERFPDMQLVMSKKASDMLPQFIDEDYSDRVIVAKENDEISLGEHTLQFILAPMVHWPEVMMTFEKKEKVFFSADAFGSFGTTRNGVSWLVEARRYYFNIVGKYGASVQTLLKKVNALGVSIIAPLHGHVLKEDLVEFLEYYDKWSKYKPERKGVLLCYASAHGNTKEAALYLSDLLQNKGEKVVIIDLNRDDMARAVEGAFCFDRTIICSITYDGELFPCVEDFLYHLKIKKFQNRKIAIVENGSWAPVAAKKIKDALSEMEGIEVIDPVLTIKTRRTKNDDSKFIELRDAIIKAGHEMDMNTM